MSGGSMPYRNVIPLFHRWSLHERHDYPFWQTGGFDNDIVLRSTLLFGVFACGLLCCHSVVDKAPERCPIT